MPQYQISREELQYLRVGLEMGDVIYADAGHIVMKSRGVNIKRR